MAQKRDWIKIIAIGLAILFFIFWIISSNNNSYANQTNQDLVVICNASIQSAVTIIASACKSQLINLQNQCELSLDTVLNCYTNNIAKCDYHTPILNTSQLD